MKKTLCIWVLACMAAFALQAQDRNVTPSPDGTMEAFTRWNDLWVRSLVDSTETRLTSTGRS